MSIVTGSRAGRAVNTYRNRLDRILREIERNVRDVRFENNNRRDEMDEILEDVRREFNRLQDGLDGLSFESSS